VTNSSIGCVVLIGAGNLALHLGQALVQQVIRVVEVYNRSAAKGEELAGRVGADFIPEISKITTQADLYIMAVADAAIMPIAESLQLGDRLLVHTSGTMDMMLLSKASVQVGVFYPLQTFPAGRPTGFSGVPVCLESNSAEGKFRLEEVARKLTDMVYFVDSDQRKLLHLSAVFACNFTNFMYTVAEDLLTSNSMPFELLKPLIAHTAENAVRGDVFRHQTGPAVRGDQPVLDIHRSLLAGHPEYLEIYNAISNNIIQYKTNHGKL